MVRTQMQDSLRKTIFHLAWSPDSLPTAQAIEPLFDYLYIHLQTLNIALFPQNFQRVLFEVSLQIIFLHSWITVFATSFILII